MENLEQSIFYTDVALTDPKLDKFKRFPFAQKVAEIISSLKDPDGIIIGIYGKWGEGKSTVLNFIEKELTEKNENKNIICVRFNPWYFRDEVTLIKSFFDTLGNSIDEYICPEKKGIKKFFYKIYIWIIRKKKCAKILNKYSDLLCGIEFQNISPEKWLKGVSKFLSNKEIEEIKVDIIKRLKKVGKRFIVFIDDIDRLDKNEIQTVFKLIKLCADFNYIVYIVAFDEEMVASAIGEKYSSNNKEPEKDKESGKDFIEKIIQIPLRLPKLDRTSLLNLCLECVQFSLKISNIKLSEEQNNEFLEHFSTGFSTTLKTPRMCKRYGNAIVSTLLMIKDEVNIVDFLLIEGIRIFYPKIYELIRNNPQIFPIPESLFDIGVTTKETLNLYSKIIEERFVGLNNEERISVKYLLKILFPNFENIFAGRENIFEDEKWTFEKRITSKEYFNRYFVYTITGDDISDKVIDEFILKVDIIPIDNVVSEIKRIVNSKNCGKFVSKIKNIILNEKFFPRKYENLAIALSKVGEIFYDSSEVLHSLSTNVYVDKLIIQLLENITEVKGRYYVAENIINECKPTILAIELFGEMLLENETGKDSTFSIEEKKKLGKNLTERILKDNKNHPLYLTRWFQGVNGKLLFGKILKILSKYGSKNEMSECFKNTFALSTIHILEFLKICYTSPAFYDYKQPEKDLIGIYNLINNVVDADIVYDFLYTIYGSVLESPKFGDDLKGLPSYKEQIAHQFAYIYHKSKEEKQKEANK